MIYVNEEAGFFGGVAKAGNIRKHGLIRASLGVPVQWQPNNPEQPIRWFCADGCRRVHGIEGCQ